MAMTQHRFVTLAVVLGVAVPVLWLAVYWSLLRGNPDLITWIMSTYHFDRVLIAVWPSWLFLIADPGERSLTIPILSIAVNALLYGILGWAIWYGLYRKRAILAVVAAVVSAGWYFLLKWYIGG